MEIKTKGFLNETEVKGSTMSGWIYKYNGCRLDELIIDCKLTHKDDFDELIKFLKVHQQSFTLLGKDRSEFK